MLEVFDRVIERGGVEGSVTGDSEIAHQARSVGETPGLREVVSEISRLRLQVVGVAARDCIRRLQVQPLPLDSRDTSQQRLADELVTEHQLTCDLGRRNESSSLCFIQGCYQRLPAAASHFPDKVWVKYPA